MTEGDVVEGLNVINDPKCNKFLNVINRLKLQITLITQISVAFEDLISAAALIRVNAVLRGITMVLSAAFWRKKLASFSTFPYALCNLTFTNKLLVKGQNKKKKLVSLKKFFILHFC